MAAQRKITSVWQYFDEQESDNEVVCQLCEQKLAYLDVNCWESKLLLATLCSQILKHLPLQPTEDAMWTSHKR